MKSEAASGERCAMTYEKHIINSQITKLNN